MILDTIEHLNLYTSLHPFFCDVITFLQEHPLESLSTGHYPIKGEDLFVNIVDAPIKGRDDARLETHRRMIDIQIPISGSEEHGYTPIEQLPEAPYIDADDISFYPGLSTNYYDVHPGQMVIYFPTDGHAPAITGTGLRKAIFKVKVVQ